MEKLEFLQSIYIQKLRSLDPSAVPLWGKMNVQQMIEHMSDSIRQANGKLLLDLVTPEANLPAYRNFLLSDKEFRQNTKNVLLGDEPEPVKNVNVGLAIDELENEINDFINYFKNLPKDATVLNPIFGPLTFSEWTHLLHKHALHHLKQFGVTVS